jgi:hypothetical protein
MKALRSYIVVASLCLPATLLHAQRKKAPPAPPATIKATVDKEKILIGEPFHLLLEVTVPDNIPFAWPGLDSMPHFDWLEKGKIDTAEAAGERSYRQYLTVTSFDSGAWAIPRLPFLVAGKKAFSDSIRINVGYTRPEPIKEFHDIKDIIDVPNPYARWIVWIVVAVTLISLTLVVWLVRKRKLLQQLLSGPPKPKLSPYEEAMQSLQDLHRQNLPVTGSLKVYYSRLNEILRNYLLRRFGIYSFAETSEELIRQLRSRELPDDIYTALAEALRMGDFVKFAKYQPGPADSEHHYNAIGAAVESLEPKIEQPTT